MLIIWHQDISTSSIIANAKIAACIALVPCLFRFRTYGLTFGLFALWSALLWDMKEVQSLVILERMSSNDKQFQIYHAFSWWTYIWWITCDVNSPQRKMIIKKI